MAYGDTILFDALKNILQTKSEEQFKKHIEMENFEKLFPRFMVLRYLSMHSNKEVSTIVLDNQVSLERFSDNKALYKFLFDFVPKQKSSWIKYIK